MDVDVFVNIGLYIGYSLLFVAIVTVVVLPLIKSLDDPQSLVKVGIGLGVLLVVFFLAYLMSGDEILSTYGADVSPGISKFVGGLLTMMYFLLGGAIVTIIYTEVANFLK